MLQDETAAGQFTVFIREFEPRLRRALTAGFGPEVGREATAEALAYSWQHWERVKGMGNPAGYLYRVGYRKARRMRPKPPPAEWPHPSSPEPWVEPGLARALARLSERQRTVVSLIHAFEWTFAEVADLLNVSKSTVQSYERRGMQKLQSELGVEQ